MLKKTKTCDLVTDRRTDLQSNSKRSSAPKNKDGY